MEKNIIVVDEQGNQYEATYPKRAKGLVKNGRARFINENTICLACPPNELDLEDKNMSENMVNTAQKPTVSYILEQMEKIAAQTEYLHMAITELGRMEYTAPESYAPADERAKALGDIVRCRETTNQKLIAFYEKLYDDQKPALSLLERKFQLLEEIAKNPPMPGPENHVPHLIETIRVLKE